MASDVSPIERLEEHPVPVDPGAIEAEFTRIWQETAGGDESTIRLRVLNFVAIGLVGDAQARFESVMAALPERHPCRGILVLPAPDAGPVSASIAAHCWRTAGGGRHVCSEEVSLRGGTDQQRALASAVLALLVPEIPVAVWLIGPPDADTSFVRDIFDAADRVFLDSALSGSAEQAFGYALEAAGRHDIVVCDIAWCRLTTWRSLVAQFFDRDDGLRELARLRSIEVLSGGRSLSSESLLLAGWLISRLGLSAADVAFAPDRLHATLYDGVNPVTLALTCGPEGDAPIQRVRLVTAGAAFLIDLHSESGHLHVRAEWPDAPVHRTVERPPLDDAAVLTDALDSDQDSAVFDAAMKAALGLLGGAVSP